MEVLAFLAFGRLRIIEHGEMVPSVSRDAPKLFQQRILEIVGGAEKTVLHVLQELQKVRRRDPPALARWARPPAKPGDYALRPLLSSHVVEPFSNAAVPGCQGLECFVVSLPIPPVQELGDVISHGVQVVLISEGAAFSLLQFRIRRETRKKKLLKLGKLDRRPGAERRRRPGEMG